MDPYHVIFTFWEKRVSRPLWRSFWFPSVSAQAAIILERSFWRSFVFFHLFFSFGESDHFGGRSFWWKKSVGDQNVIGLEKQ